MEVPVQRIVVEISNGVQQYIDDLGASDTVVGLSSVTGVSPWLTPLHQRRLDGSPIQVEGGSAINLERVLEMAPDLVLSDFTGGGGSLWRILRAGLPGIALAGRLERHPLASGEWIKLLGLLFDREAEAAAQFERIETRYRGLADRVAVVEERPRVLPMRMSSERWSDRDVIRQIVLEPFWLRRAFGAPGAIAPFIGNGIANSSRPRIRGRTHTSRGFRGDARVRLRRGALPAVVARTWLPLARRV